MVASRIDGAGDVGALLVRPDGHVAWAGTSTADPDLAATINAWSLTNA